MVDDTYTTTVSSVGSHCKTGQIHIPASVERENDLSIDDDVAVTIHGVSKFIDQASFESTVTSASRISVPAAFVREVGLTLGEQYDVTFEPVETDTLGELISTDDGEEEADEDGAGLTGLFG